MQGMVLCSTLEYDMNTTTQAAAKPAPAHPNATRANAAKKEAEAKKTREPKAPKEPKVDPILAKKIKLVVDKNPKREGSASHARFALYKNNMVVADYLKACVAKDDKAGRAARADLKWDVDHKFIELID